MEIRRFKDKNGRDWFCGKGTSEEIEELNVEKDFDSALDVLQSIRKTHNYLLNLHESSTMDKNVYGTRKNTGR